MRVTVSSPGWTWSQRSPSRGVSPPGAVLYDVKGIFPRGQSPDATRAKVNAVNKRIATLDGHAGVTYLDIGHVFLEPGDSISKDVMYDFLHPSALGYARWSAAMKPTLDRLMAQ